MANIGIKFIEYNRLRLVKNGDSKLYGAIVDEDTGEPLDLTGAIELSLIIYKKSDLSRATSLLTKSATVGAAGYGYIYFEIDSSDISSLYASENYVYFIKYISSGGTVRMAGPYSLSIY